MTNKVEELYKSVGLSQETKVSGFTEMKMTDVEGKTILYRTSPWFMGNEWYDFTMVEFNEEEIVSTYPSLMLGFLEIPKGRALSTDDKCSHYAVVRIATKSLSCQALKEEFITQFTISDKDESL